MYKKVVKKGKNTDGYEVSDDGQVKSFKQGKEIILKQQTDKDGYKRVWLSYGSRKNKGYCFVHQLVWDAFSDQERTDDLVIDHINRIRDDNRIENLRLLSTRDNCCNRKIHGKSIYRGVCKGKRDKKWRAQIHYNGKYKWLGFHDTELEASNVYEKFRREHNI